MRKWLFGLLTFTALSAPFNAAGFHPYPSPNFVTYRCPVTPGSQTFSTAGAISFTVPCYNSLQVEAWGPGGNGGPSAVCMWSYGGGGGGGGGYSKKTYDVSSFNVASTMTGTVGSPGVNTTVNGLTAESGGGGAGGGCGGGAGGAGGNGYGGDTNLSGSYGSGGGLNFSGTGGYGANGGGPSTPPGGGGNGDGYGATGQIKFTWY